LQIRVRRRLVILSWFVTVSAFLAGGGTQAALAQSAFWSTTATAGGSWGTPSNWQGGTVPSGPGSVAGFALDFTAGASVTLDGVRTIGTVFSTSANPWSLDPGFGGGLFAANFILTGGGPLTVTTALAGDNFTKDGSGTLILSSASNAYSGAVNINAGTVKLIVSGTFGTGGTAIHLAPGATLDVTGLTGGPRFGGDLDTRLAVQGDDVLDGTGTVKGGMKVKSGGTVYPGVDGVGTLNVEGKGLFEAGSTWKVKLGTAAAVGPNEVNRITFDGDLTVEAAVTMPIDGSGLTFAPGQTYDYVIATSTATFDVGAVTFQPTNFNPAAFASPASFSLIPIGSNLVLRYSPVPEPAATAVVLFAGVGAAEWRRRRATRLIRTEG
jgi:autotransporter-associated beta strand protein